jgi:hypothetical protein
MAAVIIIGPGYQVKRGWFTFCSHLSKLRLTVHLLTNELQVIARATIHAGEAIGNVPKAKGH